MDSQSRFGPPLLQPNEIKPLGAGELQGADKPRWEVRNEVPEKTPAPGDVAVSRIGSGAIQQCHNIHRLSCHTELLGHLKSHDASKGEPSQSIGTLRLNGSDLFNVVSRHGPNVGKRLFDTV